MTPILISGIGRSGTSALIEALCLHKNVLKPRVVGEAPFIKEFLWFLLQYENISMERDYNIASYHLGESERRNAFSRLMMNVQCGEVPQNEAAGIDYWVAKTILDERAFDKGKEVFGRLKVVNIIRNGAEVVNSAMRFRGFSHFGFEELCDRWVESVKVTEYLSQRSDAITIAHHDLVADPQAVFSMIFDKFGMAQDLAPGEFIASTIFNSSFDDDARGKDTKDVFSNRPSFWSSWAEDQQSAFVDICGSTMDKLEFVKPYD